MTPKQKLRTARYAKIKAFIQSHPELNASRVGQQLKVSTTQIHRIVKKEGLTLRKGHIILVTKEQATALVLQDPNVTTPAMAAHFGVSTRYLTDHGLIPATIRSEAGLPPRSPRPTGRKRRVKKRKEVKQVCKLWRASKKKIKIPPCREMRTLGVRNGDSFRA